MGPSGDASSLVLALVLVLVLVLVLLLALRPDFEMILGLPRL